MNQILGPSSSFKIEGIEEKRVKPHSLSGGKLIKIGEKFSSLFVPLAFSNPKSDQADKEIWIGLLYLSIK